MEVFEFNKSLLDRLEESASVLVTENPSQAVPSSEVRSTWAYYIELQIEPAGWQGLWKIPRVICEELKIRYPTVVFGNCEQVLFKPMRAIFVVLAVQDDNIHLAERHEVALEDLYPTCDQENPALNVEQTADCLDRLRFFYTHVWMPWDNDNDDDRDWVEKYMESRIRFCYDVRKNSMKRPLAAHIRTLLAEARYIQQRREYLELDISDDEEEDDNDMELQNISTLNEKKITNLMRLHLRLVMIRSEFELLENPDMRHMYEQVKFDKYLKTATLTVKKDTGGDDGKENKSDQRVCYIVTQPTSMDKQIEMMQTAREQMPQNCLVQMFPSLQDVLNICNASDSVFLCPGRHHIKFLEYLNDNGSIQGIRMPKHEKNNNKNNKNANQSITTTLDAVIMSNDDDSMLLVIDGDFTLSNIVLDCTNIRTGILVKSGTLNLRNCRLFGDGNSSTQQGIVCGGNAVLKLDQCTLENFATGIILRDAGTSLTMRDCLLTHCPIGVDLNGNANNVNFEKTTISGSSKFGIYIDAIPLNNSTTTNLVLKQFADLTHYKSSSWTGEVNFKDCKANIYIINEAKTLIAKQAMQCILDTKVPGDEEEAT